MGCFLCLLKRAGALRGRGEVSRVLRVGRQSAIIRLRGRAHHTRHPFRPWGIPILLNRRAFRNFSDRLFATITSAIVLSIMLAPISDQAIAAERDEVSTPVPVVLSGRMEISASSGTVELPIAVSKDWAKPQPDITRAVIIIHGWPRRDLKSGEHAAKMAGAAAARATIVITPQFVTEKDVLAHQLSLNTLQWSEDSWQQGGSSNDKAAISSFQVVDNIFQHLADRSIFPNLHVIVLAGHSAGGQFVQRYAAVGRGEAQLGDLPIHVRYVVANPASYLYFTDARPSVGSSRFTKTNFAACPLSNRWPYSLKSGVPAYALPLPALGDVEAHYLHRDVVYLLGAADNDPQSDGNDRTCAGEAEGPTRLARGLAYNSYVHMLDPSTTQQVIEVPGVGHTSWHMFGSPCGVFALFDSGSCEIGASDTKEITNQE